MAQVSPHVQQFNDIYNAQENREGGKLTQQALNQLGAIDYSKFNINEIQVVQNAEDLPDDLAVNILKGWMRRQDDLLLNLRGNLIYSPKVSKERLEQFVAMMKCPTRECKNDLVVENILFKIATGGGLRSESAVPLIDPNNFANGIIRFDQSSAGNDAKSDVQSLLDFKKETYYHNKTNKDPYFIIGLPPFMKVRLTSYKLIAPPKLSDRTAQGGSKNWDFFGSNDWNEIRTGNPTKIHSAVSDMKLHEASSEGIYNVELGDDQYFRYFKFASTGQNHQGSPEIFLSGFDISGNIIICRE